MTTYFIIAFCILTLLVLINKLLPLENIKKKNRERVDRNCNHIFDDFWHYEETKIVEQFKSPEIPNYDNRFTEGSNETCQRVVNAVIQENRIFSKDSNAVCQCIPNEITQDSKFVYQRREFLSKAEMNFFQVLRQVCGSNYYIAPKVGLWGLVQGKKTKYGNERGWAKISQKHLDFVLLNPRLMKPVLVVELDDSSHWRAERRAKDEQKDAILRQANIPVLRVPVRTSYDVDKLRETIYSIIRDFYQMD